LTFELMDVMYFMRTIKNILNVYKRNDGRWGIRWYFFALFDALVLLGAVLFVFGFLAMLFGGQ
tara:strand:+ start:485 stop:673 length:189 start_codon:yes stop_codon:yes gene_type:complete